MKTHVATNWKRTCNRLVAALLCVFAPSLFSLPAAVVTGTIVDTTGTALVTTVVFQPLSNPQADAGIVITAGPKSVTTGTNGTFSVTLEQGDYTVLIRGRDQFTIAVPNDSTTNNVTALTTDDLTYVYTADPGQYPSATENVNGGVKTDVYSADPVVYLKSSLDALLATNAAPSKLDITNGVAVRLSGSLTNVTANGITLTANGISSAVNVTAGDLQDLSSFGVFDATVPTRVRVLRDGSGYILGSGRWYNKATTDSRTSDSITIILPIDVPSDASPGRWVLEGYEQ